MNKVTELLKIKYPIIQGAMASIFYSQTSGSGI